jgi:hypothetical protein
VSVSATGIGSGDPCPICGATSGVTEDDDGFACLVCGAPRVPVTSPVRRPHNEKRLLERAKQSRLRRAAWGVVASLAMAFGGAVLVLGAVAALLFDFGVTAQALYGALVVTTLVVSGAGFWKSRRAGRDANAALEAAQVVVANEIISERGAIEASELAALLRVPVPRAEELIATAQVDRMLAGDQRLRVEEEASATDDSRADSPDAIAARKGRTD